MRDLARAAGTIGPAEDYVDPSVISGGVMTVIVDQYNSREAGAVKVEVLLMGGGGLDTILSGGSASSVTSVVTTFEQHLAKVASDGTVEHVASAPASQAGHDALRALAPTAAAGERPAQRSRQSCLDVAETARRSTSPAESPR